VEECGYLSDAVGVCATNSGSSKRAVMKQDLEQWDVKDKVTERIERSR
jgi:hypothetical protein